jgi:hypothetical protein
MEQEPTILRMVRNDIVTMMYLIHFGPRCGEALFA